MEDDESIVEFAQRHGGHWSEHPAYPVEDWQREVANDNTRLGYWEWVRTQLED